MLRSYLGVKVFCSTVDTLDIKVGFIAVHFKKSIGIDCLGKIDIRHCTAACRSKGVNLPELSVYTRIGYKGIMVLEKISFRIGKIGANKIVYCAISGSYFTSPVADALAHKLS